jgi:para-nitrobenzyl esterase
VEGLQASIRERFPSLANQLAALYPAATDAEAHERQKQLARDDGLAELRAWRSFRAQQGAVGDYGYYFERAIPWPAEPRYDAFHSAELPYMFDNLDKLDRPWDTIDRALSELMASYWVNFIARGDPNAPGLPDWPRDPVQVMRLGARPRAEALPEEPAASVLLKAFAYGGR